jgi:glyoxylase-like metal-dependent hydrolase (beta-lactamase superfamily II)
MGGYEVRVLKVGYAIPIGPAQQRASGTITLIAGPTNVLVDTGGPGDRDALLAALACEGLTAGDIDVVVCTHGHCDHTGNLNLFPEATLLVSFDVCRGDLYTDHDLAAGQPYVIDEAVTVVPTPGHSGEDTSVIARTSAGVYAVTGDLFESRADLDDDRIWRGASRDPERQAAHRHEILALADHIVPGHGDAFAVPRVAGQSRSPRRSTASGRDSTVTR